jgi:hypothetical protein
MAPYASARQTRPRSLTAGTSASAWRASQPRSREIYKAPEE